jgi:ABC-type phosphate transport system substrate-binding protein
MSTMNRCAHGCALMFALGAGLSGLPETAQGAENVRQAVVVNKANPLNQLSLTELREIFLCNRQSWPNGERIAVFQLPTEAQQRTAFERVVLGMEPGEVAQMWIDRRMRGMATEPTTVPSIKLLLRLVERTAGAIAYVRQDQVTDTVKVLLVDGKKPDDPAYPLSTRSP